MRSHFLAGRAAARAALAELGVEAGPLSPQPGGGVAWPAGTTGSISHTPGLAVAAVAHVDACRAVGVDVERADRRLVSADPRHVATALEREWLQSPPSLLADPLMLLVSAKEVVFKACCTATGVRLGFHDAELTPDENAFEARLLVEVEGVRALRVELLRVQAHVVALGAICA